MDCTVAVMDLQRVRHYWATFPFTFMCSVWDLCSPIKYLRTPIWVAASEGGFFTIGPPGKSLICQLLMWIDIISFPIMNLEEVPWVKPLHCPTPCITSPTRAQGRASVLKAEWDVFIKQQIHICFLEITPNLTLICANHKIISHGQPTLLIALVEGHLGQLIPFRVGPCFYFLGRIESDYSIKSPSLVMPP